MRLRARPGSWNLVRNRRERLDEHGAWERGHPARTKPGKTTEQARQMVSHQHIIVNGRVVDIPSYTCKVGDVISVRERDSSRGIARRNHYEGAPVPVYMEPDVAGMAGKIVTLPEREDFPK